ncbi:MAG: 4Fe-4S double cluster binding domain-containing protein [Promethearchaeota archaeon]
MSRKNYTLILREKLIDRGASLIGVANLEGLLPSSFDQFSQGVSIGVRLSDSIVDELLTGPTKAYAYHYHAVNRFLDNLAIFATNLLQKWNYRAFPIPTSQTVDLKRHKAHLSHKMVATRAGLGWIGKNALLITPEYGPRIRLTTVLTDAPLQPGNPITESLCEKCQLCTEACPVGAIRGELWIVKSERADLLDVNRCAVKIDQGKTELGAPVCGVCVRACPKGGSHSG